MFQIDFDIVFQILQTKFGNIFPAFRAEIDEEQSRFDAVVQNVRETFEHFVFRVQKVDFAEMVACHVSLFVEVVDVNSFEILDVDSNHHEFIVQTAFVFYVSQRFYSRQTIYVFRVENVLSQNFFFRFYFAVFFVDFCYFIQYLLGELRT
jgi:hypothetical protein